MPLNPDRVYMLAADHRWQWEEFCDARSLPRERIRDVEARSPTTASCWRASAPPRRASSARCSSTSSTASPVDRRRTEGRPRRRHARGEGRRDSRSRGRPIPSPRALTGAFVKVLVRYRPDDEAAMRDEQWAKLDALQAWCRGAGKPLVLEVLVARKRRARGRVRSVGPSGDAGRVHRRGVPPRPDAGVLEDRGHAVAAGRAHDRRGDRRATRRAGRSSSARPPISSTIDRWFAACAASATASGFAIGRSVFWEPSAAFLERDKIRRPTRPRTSPTTYLSLVDVVGRSGSRSRLYTRAAMGNLLGDFRYARALAGAAAHLRRRRDPDAGARHRHQHRDLQRDQGGAAEPAALPGSLAARRRVASRTPTAAWISSRRSPSWTGKQQSASVPAMAAFRQLRYAFAGNGEPLDVPSVRATREPVLGAARQRDARPHVLRRGRRARRRSRRRPQPRVLGAAFRRIARRDRPDDSARRAAVHRRSA